MPLSQASSEFYSGNTLLMPISELTGLSIDKVNFIICQLFALLLGFPYRFLLTPHKVSPNVRHFVQVLAGIPLMFFCFGWQVKHVVAQAATCLGIMRFLKPGIMEKATFVAAMGYLCVAHIYRMVYDYGGYTLDITGPLMISTQRLTSLAYNVADGRKDLSNLSDTVKRLAVRKVPSVLEFASYIFCFHGLMCGPFSFYKDYIAFINGSCYSTEKDKEVEESGSVQGNDVRLPTAIPDPTSALISKSVSTIICGLFAGLVVPRFLIISVIEPEFASHCFWYKMFYVMVSTSLHRQTYYFAWKLSELINVNAGFGFSGYDADGKPIWNLIENTDIYQIETSTSLKVLLDNWNKMTTLWLRYVVYERTHSTLAVFFFSAFWHGFYIGYYITFLTGGVLIIVSRLVRRNIRPFFQGSASMARLYDLITFVATRLSIAYVTFPFVLLEFWLTMAVYWQLYFWLHIVAFLLTITLLAYQAHQASKRKRQ